MRCRWFLGQSCLRRDGRLIRWARGMGYGLWRGEGLMGRHEPGCCLSLVIADGPVSALCQ